MLMKTRIALPRRWRVALMGLLVAAVLAVVVVVMGPFFMYIEEWPKSKVAKLEIDEFIVKALKLFRHDVGRYPTNAEGLQALVTKPADANGWDGPYIRNLSNDPWSNPYRYSNSGTGGSIEIFSLGADNAPGGEGENADVRHAVKDKVER